MGLTCLGLGQKFAPYILGNSQCTVSSDVINQIRDEFGSKVYVKGGYISASEHWMFKTGRTDGVSTTEDAHAYRVRRAARMREYIAAKGLVDHFVVPQEWLYD